MKTEELITCLSHDLPPVSRHEVGNRLALGIVVGGGVSVILLALTLGIRPDLWLAMTGKIIWVKWGYTASVAGVAVLATAQLARPDSERPRRLWLLAVPLVLLIALAAGELVRTPRSEWLAMWLGETWTECPWLVLILSVPIFGGMLWSFRRLAPTRLREAGATAGLAAGAFAATAYCLHCPEVSVLFVLTWYTLGMLLAALVGALIGPRLLRW